MGDEIPKPNIAAEAVDQNPGLMIQCCDQSRCVKSDLVRTRGFKMRAKSKSRSVSPPLFRTPPWASEPIL
jgi:hypothetical protein